MEGQLETIKNTNKVQQVGKQEIDSFFLQKNQKFYQVDDKDF